MFFWSGSFFEVYTLSRSVAYWRPSSLHHGGRCFLQSFVSFFYLMDKGAKKSEIVEFCHLTLSKSLLKKKNIIAITLLALTLSKNVPGKIRMNCQKQLTTATQQWLNNGSAITRISDSYYHASSRVKNSATG